MDIGTGGGENVLNSYPKVGMIIVTDFSKEMIKTSKEKVKKYFNKNIKFARMNNQKMKFPKEIFDLILARHTVINAKQIYNCLVDGGTVVIEGVDKNNCWKLTIMNKMI